MWNEEMKVCMKKRADLVYLNLYGRIYYSYLACQSYDMYDILYK